MKEKVFFKIVKYFIENPYEEPYLREIAKRLKVSVFAMKDYADHLVKEKILVEKRVSNLRYLKLNMSSLFVKQMKIAYNIKRIEDSGILEYIKKEVPSLSSVILFGSMASGENDKNSDVDLVIIGQSNMLKLSLQEFERKMGKEINYHVFTWAKWKKQEKENKAFYVDVIIKGIPLYGEMAAV
ncbi:MAG: nucleotidyltransferase domain-containing protein [Nanoarchaeota archaeon]